MSVHVSSWAWKQNVGSAGTKLVLLKLADNANDQGVAWPHQETIAAECEVDVRTVQRAVTKLRELGLLETIRDTSRPGSPYVYRLPWNTRQNVASGGQDVGSLGDTVSLPIREPSVEPMEAINCRVCELTFASKTKLIDHRRNVHGEDVALEEEAA